MNKRKKDILDVVLATLFSADASKRLTVAGIADKLGIAKSTLYDYFTNKHDMVQAAIEMMIDDNTKHVLNSGDVSALTFKEAFIAYMRRAFDITGQNHMAHNLYCGSDFASLPREAKQSIMDKATTSYEENRRVLKSYLDKGREAGVLGSIDDHRRAMIESMILGVLMCQSQPSYPLSVDTAIDMLYKDIVTLCKA